MVDGVDGAAAAPGPPAGCVAAGLSAGLVAGPAATSNTKIAAETGHFKRSCLKIMTEILTQAIFDRHDNPIDFDRCGFKNAGIQF
jgi:hypothetical protein